MKKLLLLSILFFNLFPAIRDDGFAIFENGCYAQSFAEEEEDPNKTCSHDYSIFVDVVDCQMHYVNYTGYYNCITLETSRDDVYGPDTYFPIPGCNPNPDYYDCNGVLNGTAVNKPPCGCIDISEDCPAEEPEEPMDCAGVPGGMAYDPGCGCIGGTTGLTECPTEDPPTEQTWYEDKDDDGWGNSEIILVTSNPPGASWVLQGGDYNDNCYNLTNAINQCPIACNNNYITETSRDIASAETLTEIDAVEGNAGGVVLPQSIEMKIAACNVGDDWVADVLSVKGKYAFNTRGWPGVQEVTGIGGNTTAGNFCDQIGQLSRISNVTSWFMHGAIVAHEEVHETHINSALTQSVAEFSQFFPEYKVPNTGQDPAAAITELEALPNFISLGNQIRIRWKAYYLLAASGDHSSGSTLNAEMAVTMPMVTSICDYARTHGWDPCLFCP